ncbi:M24 family metallopeptidase [Alkaliphilus sp. B6464]|uniref:M24 family metallopeptidase n=1 Tax=Alkaliphilus sp. B6464 TaxID=2731219 RepID=UPI001BA5CF57|nr:Xaa-Pro peptidase family protein [Alkaliphilus sp. B6464]QUH20686.1 aminopeptidase P family protein [Alkaliphilus sp. B6464]
MSKRINNLRTLLKDKGLDGILLYKPENRRYASGFTGSTGYALITKNDAKFITDFRYLDQASTQCNGYEIVEINNQKTITDVLNRLDLGKLGIEEDFMTYGQYSDFSNRLVKTELIPLEGALVDLRSVKTLDEVEYIEKAASIADEAFNHILNFVKLGMTELDIALELEFFMKKRGANKLSFESIVASGKRSSLPHGVATSKILEAGDLITLDFGCVYNGYCSDMTRTFVLGKANNKQKEIYNIVLEAQRTSLEAVKPGITGEELDGIARKIISDKGYGQYFGHGLGHGVGLEVHELPHINVRGKVPMEPGMIITIEPGIYISDFGGVRIEDLVLVTGDGYKVLSKSTKDLIELEI